MTARPEQFGDEGSGTGADETTESASSTPGPAPSPAQQSSEQVERDIGELVADVERERDEYLELARRTKADFENYRKRVAGEAAQAEKRGRGEMARELLPVLDNLDRALDAAGEGDSLVEGVRLVRDELNAILARSGVESYEPAGERFDPEWHEALMTRPAQRDEDGLVLEVLTKGYRLNGQVLRPARVVVGKEEKGPSGSDEPDGFVEGPGN
jgi:molecular chaperone GrpE